LKAFSLLRFFFALEKEMTRRHAQWLIVIKKITNLRRPLTLKAATRHRPSTPAPPRAAANSDKKISQNKTREDLESSNPALTQRPRAATRSG
jgi:hypothetical protein